jgi:hypothetical protein
MPMFVQRIPADVMSRAVGMRLAIPLGEGFVFVAVLRAVALKPLSRSISVA